MKYDYLIGETILKNNIEIEITEDLYNKAINRLISFRRKREEDYESSDDEIIEAYISEEDVITNLGPAGNLNQKKPENVIVKFDDVRKMFLSLDSLEGYEEAEKYFIQQRLNELSQDFNLEKTTDKFLAWRVAVCELKIMQLETLLVANKKEAANIDAVKQLDSLDKQYKVYCESLNVLKRQRDTAKDKPKEKLDLAANINKLDKSIKELQTEVDKARQEEKKMIEKLNKKH